MRLQTLNVFLGVNIPRPKALLHVFLHGDTNISQQISLGKRCQRKKSNSCIHLCFFDLVVTPVSYERHHQLNKASHSIYLFTAFLRFVRPCCQILLIKDQNITHTQHFQLVRRTFHRQNKA